MSNKPAARDAQARRKASPKFNEQMIALLYQIHRDPELTASALAIALEIAWSMTSLGQCSWPSLETIAQNCKLSKTSVIRIVQQLVARHAADPPGISCRPATEMGSGAIFAMTMT